MPQYDAKRVLMNGGLVVWDGITRPNETRDQKTGVTSYVYSLKCLFPPNCPDVAIFEDLARQELNNSEFRGQMPNGGTWPVSRVGPNEFKGMYTGWWCVNFKTYRSPQVFDNRGVAMQPMQYNPLVYTGQIVNVLAHCKAFNNMSKGIAARLDGFSPVVEANAPRIDFGGGASASGAFGGDGGGYNPNQPPQGNYGQPQGGGYNPQGGPGGYTPPQGAPSNYGQPQGGYNPHQPQGGPGGYGQPQGGMNQSQPPQGPGAQGGPGVGYNGYNAAGSQQNYQPNSPQGGYNPQQPPQGGYNPQQPPAGHGQPQGVSYGGAQGGPPQQSHDYMPPAGGLNTQQPQGGPGNYGHPQGAPGGYGQPQGGYNSQQPPAGYGQPQGGYNPHQPQGGPGGYNNY